jgi:hypothetical protein
LGVTQLTRTDSDVPSTVSAPSHSWNVAISSRSVFSQVIYLEVPGMKHAIPSAVELNTALVYLDAGNKPRAPSRDR